METKKLKISAIKVNEKNAKIHPQSQVDKVVASIEEFGYNTPIVVDETNTILVGHCRFEALKQIGQKEITVNVVTHLNDMQKRGYMLADNRLSEDAEWDAEKLQQELQAITEDGSINFDSIGFTDDEISQIEEELALQSESLDSEDLGGTYDPNLNPTASQKEVTQAQVEGTAEGLDKGFSDKNEEDAETAIEVDCPHCFKHFTIQP